MKSNTEIINGRLFHKIEYEMDFSEIENITSYMTEMETDIIFEKGNTENYYDNLLDNTGNFKYNDCNTLFYLGILKTSSYKGETEFSFSPGYKTRLKKLRRLSSIDCIL